MVEENGSVDPLAPSPDPPTLQIASSVGVTNSQPHLVAATNIVQLTLPTHTQGQAQVGVVYPTVHEPCMYINVLERIFLFFFRNFYIFM